MSDKHNCKCKEHGHHHHECNCKHDHEHSCCSHHNHHNDNHNNNHNHDDHQKFPTVNFETVEAKASEFKNPKVSELMALLTSNPPQELIDDARANAEQYIEYVITDMEKNNVDPEFFVHNPSSCVCEGECKCTPASHCGCLWDERFRLITVLEALEENGVYDFEKNADGLSLALNQEYGLLSAKNNPNEHSCGCGCSHHHDEHPAGLQRPLVSFNQELWKKYTDALFSKDKNSDIDGNLSEFAKTFNAKIEKLFPNFTMFEVVGSLFGALAAGNTNKLEHMLYLLVGEQNELGTVDAHFLEMCKKLQNYLMKNFLEDSFNVSDFLAQLAGCKITAFNALQTWINTISGYQFGALYTIDENNLFDSKVKEQALYFLQELNYFTRDLQQSLNEIEYKAHQIQDLKSRNKYLETLIEDNTQQNPEDQDMGVWIAQDLAMASNKQDLSTTQRPDITSIFLLLIDENLDQDS